MKVPQRWVRSRAKDAKQPASCMYVGRTGGSSMYSNWHIIVKSGKHFKVRVSEGFYDIFYNECRAHKRAVELFVHDMKKLLARNPEFFDDLLNYDYISCFCPLELPCHAGAIIKHLEQRYKILTKKAS